MPELGGGPSAEIIPSSQRRAFAVATVHGERAAPETQGLE